MSEQLSIQPEALTAEYKAALCYRDALEAYAEDPNKETARAALAIVDSARVEFGRDERDTHYLVDSAFLMIPGVAPKKGEYTSPYLTLEQGVYDDAERGSGTGKKEVPETRAKRHLRLVK